jgi:hypothetical protein
MINQITYYILVYLLIGTGVGFILESIIRWSNQDVSNGERTSFIVFWPLMIVTFMYNFIKGFFE